ncbi:MAG: aminotransferase class V-fold PLP-dependent enzyme [Endozoicomonas sp.]
MRCLQKITAVKPFELLPFFFLFLSPAAYCWKSSIEYALYFSKSGEAFFQSIRSNIAGINHVIDTPYGRFPLYYFDWAATGRIYQPVEEHLKEFYPWVANSHSAASASGAETSEAYAQARAVIRQHVHAGADDILIMTGAGMTGAINKFQRILGWQKTDHTLQRPVVFVTHMEHHSNEITWRERGADVVRIAEPPSGGVDLQDFDRLLKLYAERETKVAAVTAASNVTGIRSPLSALAEKIHRVGGWVLVDFTAAAPYDPIDMHPPIPEHHLDAIVFSPHKFLGGPGASGVLIFHRRLYPEGQAPDQPGGGTVKWVNAWGEHRYLDDPEAREDGGTPPILQTIRAAMAIRVKEDMGAFRMAVREDFLLRQLLSRLDLVPNLHVLARQQETRLPIVALTIDGLHHDLAVRLLNDHFGIQARGGCSCAGPYGHNLLNVSREQSAEITDAIDQGDYSTKPGWVRVSLHPSHSVDDINYLADALTQLASHHPSWAQDYQRESLKEAYQSKDQMVLDKIRQDRVRKLFDF